jgi:hypothetical protein
MQRSSETIGTIAAALAKAQAQLVNPEKSLVGTIPSDQTSGSERSFRYAPLSSGLDIVRKTLSQHEIATVQTTSIDETAGIVHLSTVLAHASGEWIASDWPVCAVSETAAPHRMGAALTYARRYSLFTLVGIAGEDDLDAPDLLGSKRPTSNSDRSAGNGGLDSQDLNCAPPKLVPEKSAIAVRLDVASSGEVRNLMLEELAQISNENEAAKWAHRRLPEKNKLSEADAKQVEETFRDKLVSFASEPPARMPEANNNFQTRVSKYARRRKPTDRATTVDKSVLMYPELRRLRDRDHVRFVTRQNCLICGRHPCDAHHLRIAQSQALSRKVSDEFTVPLCRGHHRELHRHGDEADWWQTTGIDPFAAAHALWLQTHPLRSSEAGEAPLA